MRSAMRVRILASTVLNLIGLAVATFAHAETSTSVVVGQCNNVTQNLKLGEGATYNVYIDCAPGKGNPGYRIRYLWLNSIQTSFLFSNYADKTLKRLVTGNPKLVKNEVYDQINKILDVSSIRPAKSNQVINPIHNKIVAPNGKTASDESGAIPDDEGLRLYAGDQPIIWFDVAASRSVKET